MKSFFRFLSRNKLYSAIEAVGLGVSLAFLIIIFCYVTEQFAVTRENKNRKEIFLLYNGDNAIGLFYGTKDLIDGKIPEIENVSRFLEIEDVPSKANDKPLTVNVLISDRSYFDLFPCTFKDGNADLIERDMAAFVSEDFARQAFGNDDVVGKAMVVGEQNYTIAGVVSNFCNSLLPKVDVVVNERQSDLLSIYKKLSFVFCGIPTFIKVKDGTDLDELKVKIDNALAETRHIRDDDGYVSLLRLDEIFFSEIHTAFNQGDLQMMKNLIAIGLLLLISAVFNYINLSVALTGKRAKEMVSRRLLGARRGDVIRIYLVESFLFTMACFVVGLALAYAVAPTVNKLMNNQIWFVISFTPKYLLYYLLMVIVVALLAGIIPALIISKVRPIDVVKGKIRLDNKIFLSKVFIVLQNAIAIVLIAIVLTMELQMRHMQDRPTGCNTENLYFLETQLFSGGWDVSENGNGAVYKPSELSSETFADMLKGLPCVEEIAKADDVPCCCHMSVGLNAINKEDKGDFAVRMLRMDSTAFKMLGFGIKAQFVTPREGMCWLTESTYSKMTGRPLDGTYNIDSVLVWQKYNFGNEICGVVEDFVINDAVHLTNEDYACIVIGKANNLLIKIKGDRKEARKAIEAEFARYAKAEKGEVEEVEISKYLDEIIAEGLKETRMKMRLIEMLMAVAVVLSLLGLVAMSTYFATEKRKTIAVRKVFGGTMASEIRKNLSEYIIIILTANVIALPIAVWLSKKYLLDFVYRIDLSPWIFIATAAISFVIAIGSVLWQIVSVANVNPAEALKNE